jgi:ABC-type branched-subunit amino acid transport system substrate-binding protein
MARQLTDKQQKFLEVLFDEANGDVVTAKKLAGYGESTSTTSIVEALKDEIADKTRTWFARTAPKAAMAMANALVDPTELGIRDKMAAAKDLLDRAGLGKVDKIDVGSSTGGVFILPSKEGKNE